MSRSLHADTLTELAKDKQLLFNMFEFHFDAGTEYYNNSFKDVVYNTNTYQATATMISFGDVVEDQELQISSMSFTVTAVSQVPLAAALTADVVNRKIVLYRALLDPDTYALINNPVSIYTGLITSYQVQETPGANSTLTWQTASVFADFDRTAGRRTNHQDQQAYLDIKGLAGPDDGFEYAHQITRDLRWGRP